MNRINNLWNMVSSLLFTSCFIAGAVITTQERAQRAFDQLPESHHRMFAAYLPDDFEWYLKDPAHKYIDLTV
jgi:hypothetical protein